MVGLVLVFIKPMRGIVLYFFEKSVVLQRRQAEFYPK